MNSFWMTLLNLKGYVQFWSIKTISSMRQKNRDMFQIWFVKCVMQNFWTNILYTRQLVIRAQFVDVLDAVLSSDGKLVFYTTLILFQLYNKSKKTIRR